MCALVTGVQTCALPIYRLGGLPLDQGSHLPRPPVGGIGRAPYLRTASRNRDFLRRRRGSSATACRFVDLPAIFASFRTGVWRGCECQSARDPRPRLRRFLSKGRLRSWQSVKSLRSEEHTSELQSLMRISYAVFCLKKKKTY